MYYELYKLYIDASCNTKIIIVIHIYSKGILLEKHPVSHDTAPVLEHTDMLVWTYWVNCTILS